MQPASAFAGSHPPNHLPEARMWTAHRLHHIDMSTQIQLILSAVFCNFKVVLLIVG